MRYLFLRENVLFMVNIRFHLPKPHWTPYDVYTKYFFIIGVSALTIVIIVRSLSAKYRPDRYRRDKSVKFGTELP